MRRCLLLLLTLILVSCLLAGSAAAASEALELPAKAYLLMDAKTGQVLYDHAGSSQLEMASTTKIMTAILALERGNLSDVVTSGQKPYDTGGTTIYLELGEQQTLENLLYALMLESANDAAVAIAEHLAGTEEKFVEWMNEKAREIGATHTHFANSHGLHDPSHYTTAHDLALIARYALNNPTFRTLITTEEREIPGFKGNPPRKLHSHDQLLGYYEGANGVKNGFTEEAGLTNVASARRGDTELIAVVLGAQDRIWTSSMAVLDYGFAHYRTEKIAQKGTPEGTVTVPGVGEVGAVVADDLWASVPVGSAAPLPSVIWQPGVQAPIPQGGRLGRIQIVQDGGEVAGVDLVTPVSVQVKESSLLSGPTLPDSVWRLVDPLVLAGVAGLVAAGLLVMRQSGLRRRRRSGRRPRNG